MTQSSSEQILQQTFGNRELIRRIKASNVLLVGAGGIGCEVLKGLLLMGFERITIIDLDTIDVSNLNRQFLYNKTHVGESKAVIAAEVSVERFSHRNPVDNQPISRVEPIRGSILSLKYNKEFYQTFTFVINALDNNKTRVHVNRMCLSADIPLVESASTGYFGNVSLIKRGVTQCFECDPPKKDENTYASCTIRSTPSLPIHCIVWAKYLFAQLFGQCEEGDEVSPDVPDLLENNNSGETASGDASANNDESDATAGESPKQPQQTTRQYVESTDYNPKALFEKIFLKDILYLKGMPDLWTDRQTPRELNYDQIVSNEIEFDDLPSNTTTITNNNKTNQNCITRDQQLWSMAECLRTFCSSLEQLKNRLKVEQILEWDKDDDVAVDFVASVSNFRSHCFYIARKSKFEVKSLAGNIIPAISSTNTVVGGYVVLQTVKLLENILPERIWKSKKPEEEGLTSAPSIDPEKLSTESESLLKNNFVVYISNTNQSALSKTAVQTLMKPKKDCITCSGEVKEIIVGLPLESVTLGSVIDDILLKKFKCIAPDITVLGVNAMLWAADVDDWDDDEDRAEKAAIRSRLLSSYKFMVDNISLQITDLEQNFKVILRLRDLEIDPAENDGDFFHIFNQEELDNYCRDVEAEEEEEVNNLNNNKNNNVTKKNKEIEDGGETNKKFSISKKLKKDTKDNDDEGDDLIDLDDEDDEDDIIMKKSGGQDDDVEELIPIDIDDEEEEEEVENNPEIDDNSFEFIEYSELEDLPLPVEDAKNRNSTSTSSNKRLLSELSETSSNNTNGTEMEPSSDNAKPDSSSQQQETIPQTNGTKRIRTN